MNRRIWARIKKRIRNYQPSIGGALIVFGGTYQVMHALLWGWWNAGKIGVNWKLCKEIRDAMRSILEGKGKPS